MEKVEVGSWLGSEGETGCSEDHEHRRERGKSREHMDPPCTAPQHQTVVPPPPPAACRRAPPPHSPTHPRAPHPLCPNPAQTSFFPQPRLPCLFPPQKYQQETSHRVPPSLPSLAPQQRPPALLQSPQVSALLNSASWPCDHFPSSPGVLL